MTDHAPGSYAPGSGGAPISKDAIALDGLAYGIDQLDAIVVFRIGDGRLHAAWVRPGSGFGAPDRAANAAAQEVADGLREAYWACLSAASRLSFPQSSGDRSDAPGVFVTLEMQARTAMMKRSRAFGIGCLFDGSMPLGMARLVTTRLAGTIEPELPLTPSSDEIPPPPRTEVSAVASTELPPTPRAEPEEPERDLPPRTLDFPSTGAAIVRRASDRPSVSRPRATNAEIDRAKRILDYLQVHAPEPHVAHLRVALRAGVTPIALERPEALAANKLALVEAAVEEILGIDLSDLERIS